MLIHSFYYKDMLLKNPKNYMNSMELLQTIEFVLVSQAILRLLHYYYNQYYNVYTNVCFNTNRNHIKIILLILLKKTNYNYNINIYYI